MKRTKTTIVVLLALMLVVVFVYMFWPYFYAVKHDFVQINNDEYYFWPSIICHSAQEFKKTPLGTTFAEIEERFGYKNGWYNHNGTAASYFYIVAPYKYIIINRHASDELINESKHASDKPIDESRALTQEEWKQRDREFVGKMQLTSMYCADADEILWEVSGPLDGFSYLD